MHAVYDLESSESLSSRHTTLAVKSIPSCDFRLVKTENLCCYVIVI